MTVVGSACDDDTVRSSDGGPGVDASPVEVAALADLLPDALLDYDPMGSPRGSRITGAGVESRSFVRQRWRNDRRRIDLEISDTVASPALRGDFDPTHDEASDTALRETTDVDGNPAVLRWTPAVGSVRVLIRDRFLVTVRVDEPRTPQEPVTLARMMDLSRLARLGGPVAGRRTAPDPKNRPLDPRRKPREGRP